MHPFKFHCHKLFLNEFFFKYTLRCLSKMILILWLLLEMSHKPTQNHENETKEKGKYMVYYKDR